MNFNSKKRISPLSHKNLLSKTDKSIILWQIINIRYTLEELQMCRQPLFIISSNQQITLKPITEIISTRFRHNSLHWSLVLKLLPILYKRINWRSAIARFRNGCNWCCHNLIPLTLCLSWCQRPNSIKMAGASAPAYYACIDAGQSIYCPLLRFCFD